MLVSIWTIKQIVLHRNIAKQQHCFGGAMLFQVAVTQVITVATEIHYLGLFVDIAAAPLHHSPTSSSFGVENALLLIPLK